MNPPSPDGARGVTDRNRLAWNLLLESELLRVARAFHSEGIDLIVLKGVPLARRLFGRLDARRMVDNDVIVHRASAVRAFEALVGLGYQPPPHRKLEPQLEIDFQLALARPLPGGGEVTFELHWGAFSPLLHPVPEGLLWSHVEPFELHDLTVNVFSKPLTLVHLAAHFEQHRLSEPAILRDLAAAWNLWRDPIDRAAVLDIARQTSLLPALDYALSAADDLGMLEAPPPRIGSKRAALLRRLLPPSRLHEKRPRHDYARTLLSLLLADPRRIPAWLRHQLFPPIENMAAIHGRPVSRGLYLRYLTRPFRPIARILGREL